MMSGCPVAFSWGNEPPGGVQTWPSCLHRRHQRPEPHEIENPPEIVGEGSQTEFATNLFYAAHQEGALVHPLFDRAKRMLNRLAASSENFGLLGNPRLHPIQDGFVLQARHRAERVPRAFRAQPTIQTG